MFWKKKRNPPLFLWATSQARERGVYGRIHTSVENGVLTFVVTHFDETRRRMQEMLEQLGITVCTISTPSELETANLGAQRAKSAVCLLPSSLLEGLAPFEKKPGAAGGDALVVVPEVHPIDEPDELIEHWAESLPYSSSCQFHSTFDSPFADSMQGIQRMRDMMARFGMAEDEALEHKWLKKAVRKAQKSNAAKAKSHQATDTQEEWFRVNL